MSAALACADGVGLLMDYLEDAVDVETRAGIDAHLAGCPRCVAFVRSYGASMAPYYSYFYDAAMTRSRVGDFAGATAAIRHALGLAPFAAARAVIASEELRGSLLSAARAWLRPSREPRKP